MVEQVTQEETEENTQDMQTATKKTDSEKPDKESDIVEGSEGEESKQKQPSAEETPAETTDAGEIEEQAQTGQVPEDTADSQDAAAEQSKAKESKQEQPSAEETPAETTDAGKIEEQAQTGQVPEDTADSQDAAAEQSNAEESQLREPDVSPEKEDTAPDPNAANDVAEKTAATSETSEEPATGKISEANRKITQSPAILRGQSAMAKNEIPGVTIDLFEIRANDIMQNQVTWASPDNSLQQVLTKMQQTDAGYIMIGQNGVLEGIVSKSDITRALSPYLQPIFVKWHRPLDDASLKIRIKWIMSRPVRTIKPETSFAAIMEYMSQFRGRCLPVTDEAGNVQGLVTAFDIFQALLKSGSNTSADDQTIEALVESAAENRPA